MNFDILEFLECLSRKFRFHENLTLIRDTLHEDLTYVYEKVSLNSF
jgi:hypothetical protein